MVSSSLFRRRCCFFCPWPLKTTAYHSAIVNCRSRMVSSALQMNNCCFDCLQCFSTADLFHSVRTAWRGVTRHKLLHEPSKSVSGHSGLVTRSFRSIVTSSSCTSPFRSRRRKSRQPISVTRTCLRNTTTVLNSSYIIRPVVKSMESVDSGEKYSESRFAPATGGN
jgi:hypothetical protein